MMNKRILFLIVGAMSLGVGCTGSTQGTGNGGNAVNNDQRPADESLGQRLPGTPSQPGAQSSPLSTPQPSKSN